MYGVTKVESWDQARRLSKKMIRWGFRGQINENWPLQPSLERLCSHFGLSLSFLANREYWILRQFQRRAHKYIPMPPPFENRLEWLALIQHHGGPTRLLDFTHSFYVAAFFAVETASSDSAIWAVDLDKIEESFQPHSYNETIDHINQRHIAAVEEVLGEKTDLLRVVDVEPDLINERMSIQQGLFLFPFNLERSFIENLTAIFGDTRSELDDSLSKRIDVNRACEEYGILPPIMKIILPHSIHFDVIDDLRNMNVTAATLFPELDGFARSLVQHLRIRIDLFDIAQQRAPADG